MDYDFLKLADKYFDSAVEDLKDLIASKSVLDEYNEYSHAPFGEGCLEALNKMLGFAKRDGFLFLNDDGYAGEIKYGNGDDIAVLGHLDVVPAEGDWKTDPFVGTIIDNKLYGRGATDDKGPVIASYYALKMLRDLGVKFNKTVKIIVGCDEESGSRCLEHYFKNHHKPEIGFSPDADYPLIYGEKAFANFEIVGTINSTIIKSWNSGSRSNIVPDTCIVELNKDLKKEFKEFLNKNNYSGEVVGNTYKTYGKAAHGSMPALGLNANFIMAEFINGIEKDNFTSFIIKYLSFDPIGEKMGIDILNADMGSLSLNPGIFKVNEGKVLIVCDCRTPKNEWYKVVDEKVSMASKEFGLEYKVGERKDMHYVDPNSNLVKSLYKAYKEISLDNESKPFTIGGGTYAKFIDNCVAFGPTFRGCDDLIHSPNEFIDLENFKKDIAIYAYAIYELVK